MSIHVCVCPQTLNSEVKDSHKLEIKPSPKDTLESQLQTYTTAPWFPTTTDHFKKWNLKTLV